MTTTSTLKASTLSATIKKAGFALAYSGSARPREGVRVSQGYDDRRVTVIADFDIEARAIRRAAEIREALADLGYTVEANPEAPYILTVSR